jgi:hypothetical protein
MDDDRKRRLSRAATALAGFVAFAALGAALGAAWVWRDRLVAVGAWWLLALAALAVVALRFRPSTPKSAAHPALQVRPSPRRIPRAVVRPIARRGLVPNVFVDGDSFAENAWPGADLTVSRRWTVDASERVASRFGTDVAVVLGVGADGVAGRQHVRVAVVPDGDSLIDVLWRLIAAVDPKLPILFVTDDEATARAALAHGLEIMPCRGWMNLAERLVAPPERSAGAA